MFVLYELEENKKCQVSLVIRYIIIFTGNNGIKTITHGYGHGEGRTEPRFMINCHYEYITDIYALICKNHLNHDENLLTSLTSSIVW